jgi:hypothetical protein
VRRNEELLEELVGRVSTRRANAIRAVQKTRVDVAAADAQRVAENAQAAIDAADLPSDDGTPPADPLGAAVFVAKDATTGSVRVEFPIANPGSPDYVRRAQVRWRKTGTTTWTVEEADPDLGLSPMLSVGTLSPADVIEAQVRYVDFFGRASNWTPDPPKASIEETYFPYLRADRIRSGTITAEALTLAGSASPASLTLIDSSFLRVRDATAGVDRIKLSAEGLELHQTSSEASVQANMVGRAIFPLAGNRHSALWFFSATGSGTTNTRGIQVRSDGASGSTIQGLINLVATYDPTTAIDDATSFARVRLIPRNLTNLPPFDTASIAGVQVRHGLHVLSGAGGAGGHLRVDGRSFFAGALETNARVWAKGGADGIDLLTDLDAYIGRDLRVVRNVVSTSGDLILTTASGTGSVRSLIGLRADGNVTADGGVFNVSVSGRNLTLSPGSGGVVAATTSLEASSFAAQFRISRSIAASTTISITHGLGTIPRIISVMVKAPEFTDRWYPIETATNLRIEYVTTDWLTISNSATTGRDIRVDVYR